MSWLQLTNQAKVDEVVVNVLETAIPEVLIFEPKVTSDPRGFFSETWNSRVYQNALGSSIKFVQDNHSQSRLGVLRGLHYQVEQVQAKLVRVSRGKVFDVAVDVRRSSPTFGKWIGTELSDENHRQMWVPVGFAHGFLVLSEVADVLYKVTDYYAPEHERCIKWNDPAIAISWPIDGEPILSPRDLGGAFLAAADVFT